MTSGEIRIAIAEACGWREPANRSNPLYHSPRHIPGQTLATVDMTQDKDWICGFPPGENKLKDLPDYISDLNAMHDVIMVGAEWEGFGFQALFQLKLQEVVERRRSDLNREQIGWWMNNATASQRAEAFLKTIGKWVDP